MTLREYIARGFELLTSAQLETFAPWLTSDLYDALKINIKHSYSARVMDVDEDSETLEEDVQELVNAFFIKNTYKYKKYFETLSLEYDPLDSRKTVIDKDSTDELEHGLKVEYTPETISFQAERTNDAQTLTDIRKSYSQNSDTTENTGKDTRTLTDDETITEQVDPQEAINKERAAANFVYLDIISVDLVNYLCLTNWEV